MGINTFLAAGSLGVVAAAAATVAVTSGTTTSTTPAAASIAATAAVSDADASRLAEQATFGATPAVVARIKQLGINGWLDEQFALKNSSYEDLAGLAVRNSYCSIEGKTNPYCFKIYRDSALPAMRFYRNAISNDDQLRQRVALALFNFMPVSSLKTADTAALARYQQIMLDNAFGNFSNLLRAVVMSGAMSHYLDHANSNMSSPNENLARELMQLFSIGPNSIHANGIARLDATGAPVANYTTKDVAEVARALTGWTYTRFAGVKAYDNGVNDLSKPMTADPAAFDPGAKSFLGITVPAGATQSANVDAVIKRLLNHESMSPRITRLLIQALVKSNPSPEYISRASSFFRNNRSGVTGDLRATIRAILTDPEARAADVTGRGGKLKDPILLETSIARTIGMKTDGYAFTVRDVQMGQQFLRGPSIFGDYPPDYPLAGVKNVVSPASKLMTVGSIMERHNFIWQWTMTGDAARAEYATPSWVPNAGTTTQDWTQWEGFGGNVDAMIDRINLLMLQNGMTAEQRAALKKAMILVTDPSPTLQARRRAQTGIFIVASSPQFQIDR